MNRALLALALFAPPLGLAQTHSGTLSDTDPARAGGARYDAYTFTAQAGQEVTVRMTSDAFDTYLIVKGPDGSEHANDDFESTRVSQVRFVAAEGGTWTVWASAFNESNRGAYSVEITPGRIARVETVEGRLDPRDRELPKGEHYDLMERAMPTGSSFTVELAAYGFNGFLVLESPSGKFYRSGEAQDVGEGTGTLIRLSDVAPETGSWKVYVTTDGPGGLGAYDLRVISFPG